MKYEKNCEGESVGYFFPTERMCHRLKAHPGFRLNPNFGTGVAFKISDKYQVEERPDKLR